MVEDVEKLRVVLEMEALGQLEILEDGEIETALEWATEDIAAAGPIAIFEVVTRAGHGVARWNAVRPRSEWNGGAERQSIQHRFPRIDTGGSLQKGTDFLGTEAADGDNGVGDEILGTPENAADASGEINHAIWLAALQHGDSADAPAVDHVFHKCRRVGERGKRVLIADDEDVGTVEVRVAIGRTRVERVVAVIEQAEGTLLIEGVRPGVGTGHEEAVAQALGDAHLQSVVARHPHRFIEVGVGFVAGERNTEIDIALAEAGDNRAEALDGDTGGVIGIGKVLLVGASLEGWFLRRGDPGLVEGYGHNQVNAVIADVGNVDQDCVEGLPLQIEIPVFRVRQLVLGIVAPEEKWTTA